MNYRERERICQASFDMGGQFWHCYTSGKETDILFISDGDFVFAMNVIAQAALLFQDRVGVIALAIMNNHFHFILTGIETDIMEYFSFIKKRLARGNQAVAKLQLQFKLASDLQTLRNNIVLAPCATFQTHRNSTSPAPSIMTTVLPTARSDAYSA